MFDGETMPHRLLRHEPVPRYAPRARKGAAHRAAAAAWVVPHLASRREASIAAVLIAEIKRHPRPGQHEEHGPHPQSRRATNTQNPLMRGTSSLDSPTRLS